MATNTVGPGRGPGILRYGRWPIVRYSLVLLAVFGGTLLLYPGLLRNLFSETYLPHGACLDWDPALLWLHVGSDTLIGLSYVAISFTLAYLVHRARRDIPFSWVFIAFGLFIIACGSTHLMEVVTLWRPLYWLSGDLKLITAIASVATAIVLPPLVPKTLTMIRAAKESEERKVKLEGAYREMESLNTRLREMDEVKTQFFANVSHELRTPLALTLGRTEKMLSSPALTEQQRRDLEVVHRNARALLKQVNDLLDVSKLDAGKMAIHYAQLDLARLVRRTVANFDSLATDRGIAFRYAGPESLPAEADPEKIERILLNLLSNAFKFTPDGGQVRCELQTHGHRARITVADSGPGVTPEMREAIFERFRQGDGGNTRRFGGTGLGLAIVKDFSELHGGTIDLEDAPEGGAQFSVELPLHAPLSAQVGVAGDGDAGNMAEMAQATVEELAPAPVPAAAPASAETMLASAPLVLVVEDNPEMNNFISESLAGEYRVANAFNGREGLNKAMELRPDVILSDVMMPEMSGDQLVREIRTRREFDTTPIILLTARADQQSRVSALRAGAQDYIMKPFSVEEVRVRVHNLTSLSRARRVLQEELESQSSDVQELAQEVAFRKRQLHSALEALRNSESRFRRLVESNIVGVIVATLDGQITEANEAFLALSGYTRQQLEAGEIRWAEMTPPEYIQADQRALDQLRTTGVAAPWEKEYFSADGSRVPVLIGCAMLGTAENSAICFVVDLTERRRAQQEIHRLAQIVETSSDAIYSVTIDGIITSWNAAAEATFGHSAADAIGKSATMLRPPENNEVPDLLNRIRQGIPVTHHQSQFVHADGRRLEVSLTMSPIRDPHGQVIGASTIARDISEQKRTEQILRNSERLATVGRLAATIAHEINNPLEAVTNVLYLIASHPSLDDEVRSYVSLADSEVTRIAHIVKQTLAFHREAPSPVPVNVAQLLDNVLDLFARKISNSGIELTRRYDLAREVPAFPAEMRQVFSNLIGNAIEAMAGKGGKLRVHVRATRDWADPSRCGVRVTVADTGSGISRETRRHLFEPFFTTKGEKGTGLGLWVSLGIVSKHGGHLRMWSSTRPGRSGTAFCVFIPSEVPTGQETGMIPGSNVEARGEGK